MEKTELNFPIMSIAPQVPKDAQGRISWKQLGANPTYLAAFIQAESSLFYQNHGTLNNSILHQAHRSALSAAINKHYPGGWFKLNDDLGLQTDHKPIGYWTPENILAEVKAFLVQHGNFSSNLLVANGRADITTAVTKHYPGQWYQLRLDLNLKPTKPHQFWTQDNIKKEVNEFYREHGAISKSLFRRAGRSELESAVKKYPGGINALKRELGAPMKSKPHGYWTVDIIFAEASAFYAESGNLTTDSLGQAGKKGLRRAILEKYPGGIRQIQQDLGIELHKKEMGYWTKDTIREQAQAFYDQFGILTHPALVLNGRIDLVNAIRSYPGRIRQLQQDLGVQSNKKPNGYWSVENTEEEALNFFRFHQAFEFTLLRANKAFALMNAIRKYPGSIKALQEKLGISPLDQENISANEANDDLNGLLEV